MGKGADVTILALVYFVRVILTKFGLILFWVIKVFNTVVCPVASVTDWALKALGISDRTHFRGVSVRGTATIL